jgi:hypothetical protein
MKNVKMPPCMDITHLFEEIRQYFEDRRNAESIYDTITKKDTQYHYATHPL